ncbi:MAG: agmatine deiminase family protein [Pseudomonadota bacterium]
MADANTPKADGFFMPPEWARHERAWMMWPSRTEVWSDIEATRKNYRDVAHAIRRFEPMTMVVRSEDAKAAADVLGADIDLLESPINDSWCRDAGPCFLVDDKGNRAGVSFSFNAWGGKYAPFDGDNAVAGDILRAADVPMYSSNLIAEGGGLSVDGEGTLLTTRTCFPNANRNPNWSEAQIENELKAMLGVDKVIWLPGNPLETETDGHVDCIATFVAPGKILSVAEGSAANPFQAHNRANLEALQGQTDAKGRAIEIVTIPDAETAQSDIERFCRSYVNSFIVNGGVIMPSYGIAEDAFVRETWEAIYPNREITIVPIDAIAEGGGGIHCITQQEPAA